LADGQADGGVIEQFCISRSANTLKRCSHLLQMYKRSASSILMAPVRVTVPRTETMPPTSRDRIEETLRLQTESHIGGTTRRMWRSSLANMKSLLSLEARMRFETLRRASLKRGSSAVGLCISSVPSCWLKSSRLSMFTSTG